MRRQFFFILASQGEACGILVPQPGIKPTPPAVVAQIINHWTAREVPCVDNSKQGQWGNSLVVQWLGLSALTAGALGSIPGPGTKNLQAEWHSQKIKNKQGQW